MVQINNIHIIRDLIGKKGCGIYQMNKTNKRQSDWLMTRIKQAAPEILVVAD